MEIVVQKFGGTSVATRDRRKLVINKILQCKETGKSVVVVLSAMGRKGEPYATDTLKDLVATSYSGHSLKTISIVMCPISMLDWTNISNGIDCLIWIYVRMLKKVCKK